MAMERQLWCAITDDDDIVGMSYANVSEDLTEVEVGGLMVDPSTRGKGVGDVLMFLPLAHFLVNEQPLSWDIPPRIITHTLRDNLMPRGIIARVGFRHDRDVVIPGSALPGLRTEPDGNVHGVEFLFEVPGGLRSVAGWLGDWSGVLRDGSPATIEMRPGEQLSDWASAVGEMADEHTPCEPVATPDASDPAEAIDPAADTDTP